MIHPEVNLDPGQAREWQVSERGYHADRLRFGSSGIRSAWESLESFHADYLHPSDDCVSVAMKMGRAAHLYTLQPALAQSAIRTPPEIELKKGGMKPMPKTGEQRAQFESDNPEALWLDPDQQEACIAMAQAVLTDPIAAKFLGGGGFFEQSIEFRCAASGLPCKVRVDFRQQDGALVDLKTCNNPKPEHFMHDIYQRAYHVQMAHYRHGLQLLTGEKFDPYIIAVRNKPPFDVWVYQLEGPELDFGAQVLRKAKEKLAKALEAGRWREPGRSKIHPIRFREYIMQTEYAEACS